MTAIAQQRSLLSRVRVSPPARLAKELVKRVAECAVERRLGIRTSGSTLATHTRGGVHRDSNWYEPINYILLGKCLRALQLQEQDVVFDIGCGLGRVVCVLARRRIKKCVGIDLDEQFVALARANVEGMRGRRSPVEVLAIDAALADYDEGTAFYLFNSFGAATMSAVIERIHASVLRSPRPIRIIYVNPMQNHVFESAGWLRRRQDVRSPLYEMRATLWDYEPPAVGGARG